MRKKKRINHQRFEHRADFGLSDDQVSIQKENGDANISSINTGKTYGQIIFENVFTLFNVLMTAIAILLFIFIGTKILTNLGFMIIIISNTLISIIQECKSKRVLGKLRLLSLGTVTVMRNGTEKDIPPNEIVLDDIIILKPGDEIPVDGIIMTDGIFEINESLLTGESQAVKKKAGDKVLAGSSVISGKFRIYADAVGDNTYIRSIENKAKSFKKQKSKMMVSLQRIVKTFVFIAVPLAIIVFWVEYLWGTRYPEGLIYISSTDGGLIKYLYDDAIKRAFMWAAFTIVYMVPAGMLLLASISLTTGVISLSRKKVLTQDIYSVEALSRINTLCLDKTGTLTDGSMIVEETIPYDHELDYKEVISSYMSAFDYENQTSTAIVDKFGKMNYHYVTKSVPFSSERKYSLVEFEDIGTFALGAPEYLTKDPKILKKVKEYASQGRRVVLLMRSKNPIKDDKLPTKRSIFAMFVIRDNIRPEVRSTMEWFAGNDVDIRVISGDNITTVSYIAKECGIQNWDKCLDMSMVDASAQDYEYQIMSHSIYGRVSPEQKAEIVEILKRNGRVVGMTGDGINDLISLKKADCSIALANGVPATKNVSNLVLMDSNFDNMRLAVLEGRRVVNNIQRSASMFIMKDVLWILITILPLLLNVPHCIESTVMSMVNTMITGLASVLIALEPSKERIKGNFTKTILGKAIVSGFYMFLPVLFVYIFSIFYYGNSSDPIAFNNEISSMMPVISLCITIAGFVVFFNMCRPFTTYRGFVFGIILGISVFLLLLVPEAYLKNGTEWMTEIIEKSTADGHFEFWRLVGTFLDTFFSFKIYKEFGQEEWLIISIFAGVSFIIYYFTDKGISKLLDITMFNKNRFDDDEPKK